MVSHDLGHRRRCSRREGYWPLARCTSPAHEQLEPRMLLAVLNWSGDLPDGTVWAGSDIHLITADARVPAGASLTIEPGAIIKFQSFSADLRVEGALAAQGTADRNITFTERRDDVGGDTNGDGTDSLPAPGNWGRIEIAAGGSATIRHAQIRYGGFGSAGQLTVAGGSLTLADTTVSYSNSDGVRIQNSSPTLERVTFRNNRNAAASMDLNSNPAITSVTVDSNAINGLQVDAGTLAGDGFWDDPDIVYWLDGDVTVPANVTLTVGAGQIVKFGSFSSDLIVNGTLRAQGTAADPIIFTDGRDDTAGGDTNNDGQASTSTRGNRGAIRLTGPNNVMDHVDIRYGGFSFPAQLIVDGGQLVLSNSVLRDAFGDGIRIQNSSPTLRQVTFLNNSSAAASMDLNSNPAITGVTVQNNAINGLQVDAGTLGSNGFWDDPDIVYWLDGDVTVQENVTLTVGAGQIVKFGPFSGDLVVNGTLRAQGTRLAPIIFTDGRDDPAGGDTNNDGDASASIRGNRGAIRLTGPNNVMDHVDIRYGGFSFPAQLIVDGGQLVLSNSVLRDSATGGIALQGDLEYSLVNNIVAGNSGPAVEVTGQANVAFVNNTLHGNSHGVVLGAGVQRARLQNNLISFHSRAGISAADPASVEMLHNNLFNPTASFGNYQGMADRTDMDGNQSADPLYVDAPNFDFRLQDRSPAIDAGLNTAAPATDFLGNPRVDDPGVANTGAGPQPFVDIGALERQGESIPINLRGIQASLSAASVVVGSSVTVSWQFANTESQPAPSPWTDAVFLSSDATWDSSDKLLGQVVRTEDLAGGAASTGELTFTAPATTVEQLFLIVRLEHGGS